MKRRRRLDSIIADLSVMDLLFLQENTRDISSTSEFRSGWNLFLPPNDNNHQYPHRACIAASSHASTSLQLHQLAPPEFKYNRDVVLLHAKNIDLYLFCVYNDTRSETLHQLTEFLSNNHHVSNKCLFVGDFNAHHELWEPSNAKRQDKAGRTLHDLIKTHNLHLHTPPDFHSFFPASNHASPTTIDLVFSSDPFLISKYAKFEPTLHQSHDHRPFEFVISPPSFDPSAPVSVLEPRYNMKNVDWDAFNTSLRSLTDPLDLLPLKNSRDLNYMVDALYEAINLTQEDLLPTLKINGKPKKSRWWNDTCKILKSKHSKTSRDLKKAMGMSNDPESIKKMRSSLRKSSNHFYHSLAHQKKLYLQDLIKSSGATQDWSLYGKHILIPGNRKIPLLKDETGTTVNSWPENFKLLEKRFFGTTKTKPSRPAASAVPSNCKDFPPILESELSNAVERLNNTTSGGPDKIPITLVKSIFSTIKPTLLRIMNGILFLGHHPERWKHATTIILAKHGKPDYHLPKAYRPIALLNLFTRIFEGVMAKRLSYLAEACCLLPDQQHGFRKNHQTADGLVELKCSIKSNWSKGKVVSGCSMDMRGAYDNVDHALLIAKLKSLKLPVYITKWLTHFLSNRSTHLVNASEKGMLLFLLRGLPQGSPASPILFNIFTSDLVKDLAALIPTTAFADDLFVYTADTSVKQNMRRLEEAFHVATQWGVKNKMEFDYDKTNLIHFSRKKSQTLLNTFTMNLHDSTIKPQDHILFLGVYFDTRLTWKIHLEHLAVKTKAKWNYIMQRSRSLAHLSCNTRRTLYKGVIDPIMIYCAAVWSDAASIFFRPIERAQYQMCRQTCGAMTNTKRSTCITEAGLIPIRIRVNSVARIYFGKIITKEARCRFYTSFPPWHQPLTAFEFIPGSCPIQATLDMETTMADWKPHITGFTDGSVKEDQKAGSGFTWSNSLISIDSALRLEDGSDIFEAEWWAIFECLKSCLDHHHTHPWTRLVIFTDSQSNVIKWNSMKDGKHPHMEKCLWNLNRQLLNNNCEVKIQWIPSHSEIALNDKADALANEATLLQSIDIVPYPNPSKTESCLRKLDKSIILEWFNAEKSSYSVIQKSLTAPEPDMAAIHGNLSFQHSVWTTWLRTGHTPLNAHLHRMKKRDNPFCGCSTPDDLKIESTDHFLFKCSNNALARKRWLNPNDSPPDLVEMMSHKQGRQNILNFIKQSKRFKK